MTLKLEETNKIQLCTTFRYRVEITGYDIPYCEERMLDLGDYVIKSKESRSQLELSLMMADTCKDLIKVLNKETMVSKVVIYRRGEQDNDLFKSSYNIIEDSIDWDTFVASEEYGVTNLELVVKKYGSWEQMFMNESTLDIFKITGKLQDRDKDIGNQVTQVNLKFRVDEYNHSFVTKEK